MLIEEKSLPGRTVFWRYRNQKVARNDEWKLLIDGDTTHLYNLREDLSEQHDLAESEESIAGQLKAELDLWERDLARAGKMKTN